MIAYEIKLSPGKGLGMFANQSIERGTRILSDKPLFMPPRWSSPEDVYALFKSLPQEKKEKLLQLDALQLKVDSLTKFYKTSPSMSEEDRKLMFQVFAIVSTNAYGLWKDGVHIAGVFQDSPRINHSCCPNVIFEWSSMIGALTAHATKPIRAGEEITVSYVMAFLSRHQRQQGLASYGFFCTCPACDDAFTLTEEGEASQRRRERIHRLENDLRFLDQRDLLHQIFGPLNTTLVNSDGVVQPFEAVEEVAKLLSIEDLTLESLASWYVAFCRSVMTLHG